MHSSGQYLRTHWLHQKSYRSFHCIPVKKLKGIFKGKALDEIKVIKNELIKVGKHPKSLYIFYHPNGERVRDIRKSFWTVFTNSGIKDF